MTRVRTVHLLDSRPEERLQAQRVVEGVSIDRNIAPPQDRRVRLKRILAALQVGESFEHTGSGTWTRRLLKDRVFTARKLAPNRYRIWRIA